MKSDSSAPSWLRFFMSAGIQKDSAETYAVTFSKNQIQLDMLPEIKKEYLVDMGITLMGHIIAILRHAKTVHTEEVTKSTLSTNKPGSTVASKVSAPASKPISKTTPIVKDRVQTPAVASKVTPTPVKTVAPTARPRPTTEVVEVVEKRKEKPVPDVMVTKVSYGPKMPPKTAPPRPPELTPKRKLSDEEAGHVDESESKKKIFHRLGRAPSPEPSTNSSSVNGESVFARLGQKTAEPERLVPTVKVVAAPQKFPVKPIISLVKQPVAPAMRTALIADPTPKEKVMMINKGVLTKTMRADQDAPTKILSSTTLSADHTSQTIQNARAGKNQVHYRLGRAAMDMMAPKPANSVKTKRVSFGSVIEKTIPSNTEPTFASFKSRTNASALHSPYRRASVGAAGVFSRLGM